MKICSYLRLDLEWNVYPGTHIHTHSDTPRHTNHTHTHPSSPAFLMMYSAYKLNKQGDSI